MCVPAAWTFKNESAAGGFEFHFFPRGTVLSTGRGRKNERGGGVGGFGAGLDVSLVSPAARGLGFSGSLAAGDAEGRFGIKGGFSRVGADGFFST